MVPPSVSTSRKVKYTFPCTPVSSTLFKGLFDTLESKKKRDWTQLEQHVCYAMLCTPQCKFQVPTSTLFTKKPESTEVWFRHRMESLLQASSLRLDWAGYDPMYFFNCWAGNWWKTGNGKWAMEGPASHLQKWRHKGSNSQTSRITHCANHQEQLLVTSVSYNCQLQLEVATISYNHHLQLSVTTIRQPMLNESGR